MAAALDGGFRRALLRELREYPSQQRVQLVFERTDHRASIVVSLRPELPWIGRPADRAVGSPPGTPFGTTCAKALAGTVLEAVLKPGADRTVELRFAGGMVLVAELATHRANLVLLDAGRTVLATARRPRAAQTRLAVGERYQPPPLPPGKLVPRGCEPSQIDAFIRETVSRGEEVIEVLRRHVFGVGSAGARLVLEEALAHGATPGTVLASRLDALERGALDPVVVSPVEDPIVEAEEGRLDPRSMELLPWPSEISGSGSHLLRREDAAATAGLYYGAVDRAVWLEHRREALLAILRAEVGRLTDAERRVQDDLCGFEDPDRYRRFGEALLAGLSSARRAGDIAHVADPYDPDGSEILVPAPARLSLPAAADAHFRRHRRAKRGLEAAQGRLEAIRTRGARLVRILDAHADPRGLDASRRLAEAMRAEGIPVGLEPETRAGRAVAVRGRPRLEGVRLYTSVDGIPILVGRNGRDNDRLTFKLAGPEDFWLHAASVPGAHVIVRNPRQEARPPRSTLEEAAGFAAWFSDARDSAHADVQWTRRKNVRRIRGAPPGTVTVKRFETLRVRPKGPQNESLTH